MKVEFYILNCDGHKLRYKKFKDQPGAQPFERIPCVHYKKVGVRTMCAMLHDKLKGSKSIIKKPSDRRMVEIAISFSHYKMWQQFLNSNADYCVVVEDDVKLHKNFATCVRQAIHKLKNKFDILYLWHGLWTVDEDIVESGYDYRKDRKLQEEGTLKLDCGNTKVYKFNRKHVGGTVAYVISRSYAHYLSSKFFPIDLPVDNFMGLRKMRRQGKSNAHLVLEMQIGKTVNHHDFETKQKRSLLVDTDLEESTQVMSAPLMEKVCSRKKYKPRSGSAFIRSLTK